MCISSGKKHFYRFLFVGLLLVGISISAPTAGLAAEYFVDVNNGSDSNTGLSPAQAFKTLHHALPLTAEGDTLRVMAGVYSVANGEADEPLDFGWNLTITGDPSGATILDGAGAVGWTIGLSSSNSGFATLIANLVFKNFADYGIELFGSDANVDKCRFENNGTGVFIGAEGNSSANLENCIFSGNVVYGLEIVVVAGFGNPFVYHSTFDGGLVGVFNGSDSTVLVGIRYNIFANQTVNGVHNPSGTISVDYNCFYNSGSGYISGGSLGANDITANPLFVSGYRLGASSPCVDAIPPAASDPVFEDYDGLYRPYNSNWDMGAFEYRALLTQSITFNPGATVQDFTIAAMPLAVANPSPEAVLGPYVTPYDTTKVRVGRWNPYMQTYEEYPFSGDDRDILPGDSAWFLFRDGRTMTFNGYKAPTQAAPMTGYTSTALPLEMGWNMVGNPFDHPVSLASADCMIQDIETYEPLSTGNMTQGIFWVYINGTYLSATKLNTGQGGWVYCNVPSARIYFRDLAVPYSLVERDASAYQVVSDSYQRPPAPPGTVDGGGGAGAGGGGGGGCFIEASMP